MKTLITILLFSLLASCTHNPNANPEGTKAQAAMDQVKELKRIADALDTLIKLNRK